MQISFSEVLNSAESLPISPNTLMGEDSDHYIIRVGSVVEVNREFG